MEQVVRHNLMAADAVHLQAALVWQARQAEGRVIFVFSSFLTLPRVCPFIQTKSLSERLFSLSK